MRKELQCVDPFRLSIAREELLVEAYVSFGVDASCGLAWGPLDGAVDGFILVVFVDVSSCQCIDQGSRRGPRRDTLRDG